jgi:hypothetical protein
MDPVSAFGLASCIVQFIQFTANLIYTTVEIRRSSVGCTEDVLTLDTLYGQLHDFNSQLATNHDKAGGYLNSRGSESSRNYASFRTVSLLCKSDCEKLLQVVDKLKVRDDSRGRWRSFRTALKMIWKKDDIENLEMRLHRTQTTMTLHICTIARFVIYHHFNISDQIEQ